jgi:multidrug efflux system membrane fusion protein
MNQMLSTREIPAIRPRRPVRGTVIAIVLVALAAGGLWWIVSHRRHAAEEAAKEHHGGDAVPVVVASAERRDVPIWLDGLGTVQASATVTVRSQVDGTLIEVPVREGQDVRRGDVLARIDPRGFQASLDQALAKKAQDQANLANARVDLARYAKLAATAYTSAQQADTQRATVAQLEAQVAQDQAQIDSARVQLGYATITAPVDGRVGFRQVDAGNVVHAADTTGLMVITTLRPIWVVFTLPQQALPQVSAAQARGMPQALALAQEAGGTAGRDPLDRGTLTVVDNQVDTNTGTIRLKATFPNADLKLWPGAFVTVRLNVATVHDAVVVPTVAVQRGPAGTYVYVTRADGTAVRRPVRTGHEGQTVTVVAEGLEAGEPVVVDGASRVTDSGRIAIVPPAGSPAAKPSAP